MGENTLIQVRNLKKYFPYKKSLFGRDSVNLKAVDNVSFDILEGETLGLVGETGCGKSTLGKMIVGLLEPTSGDIFFRGKKITNYEKNDNKTLRQKIQFIFQDPSASLNPRRRIDNILSEPYEIHNLYTKEERDIRIKRLMEVVGLAPYHLKRYPHELSGGQKQRIGIARALALNPDLIVCDEPVSALDVSIQAQVINLLEDLQKEFKLTFLFISHDLSVVHHISDRVGVMYLGQLVEVASYQELYSNSLHPYTTALLSAIPVADPDYERNRIILSGDLPSPAKPPSGCRFSTRCPKVMEVCSEKEPKLEEKLTNHYVACHLYDCAKEAASI